MTRFLTTFLLLIVAGCSGNEGSERSQTAENSGNSQPELVSVGPAVSVKDGFRGAVHPLLHGQTQLKVTAQWSPIGSGDALRLGYFPERFYQPFRNVRLNEQHRIYTEQDFSGFLPAQLESAGQIWALDRKRVIGFLTQFHPKPSCQLVAAGRRAGPDGAFGVLRSVSATHFEILFRIHAEFTMERATWFTPAYFSGRMLVNRKLGTVEFFHMAIPTNQTLNATLTVTLPVEALIDIVHIDRMEMTGGSDKLADEVDWEDAISMEEAHRKLKTTYFKFMEIAWVPQDKALEMARKSRKPIFAVVLWGQLDDQSC